MSYSIHGFAHRGQLVNVIEETIRNSCTDATDALGERVQVDLGGMARVMAANVANALDTGKPYRDATVDEFVEKVRLLRDLPRHPDDAEGIEG